VREQYDALKKHFDAAKVDYQVIEYLGAVHAGAIWRMLRYEGLQLGTME